MPESPVILVPEGVELSTTILWLQNPQQIREKLPLKLPDYEGSLAKRTKTWLDIGTARDVRKARQAEWERCKYDIIHFIETWGWLFNPLYEAPYDRIPAILFDYQKELIRFLRKTLEECNRASSYRRENIALKKCRETAGSWSGCFVTVHDFLFWNGMHLWMSRKEEEVDQPGNMDTPFEKMRSILRSIPDWLLPEGFDWRKHSNVRLLLNPLGGSIEGESMNKDAGAGGRKRCVWFDEFARANPGTDFSAWRSTSLTTNMRVAICSPEGPNNKFARLCEGKDGERCIVINLDWWKDPRKMQGAEWIGDELTSPWYREAETTLDKQTFNSQVLMSFASSVKGQVFEEYSASDHVRRLKPIPGLPVIVGIDPGPHFVATYTHLKPCGCYWLLRQTYWENADIDKVGRDICAALATHYGGYQIQLCGDPAGSHVNSAVQKNRSDFLYLSQEFKLNIQYKFMYKIPREDWVTGRLQAAKVKMGQFCSKCKGPALQVDMDNCPLILRGFGGEYRYKTNAAGESTGILDEFHPIEDSMDSALYPLLFLKQFLPKSERQKIKVPQSAIPWGRPSTMQGMRRF